ncbi:MAG: histidine phosphatase family protein [Minisyncoccia bacterium]
MIQKEVYFVRHGESESNADGVHRGREALITEKGIEQAKEVAKRVEKLHIDALIATSFPRARVTAEHIRERIGLPIEENDLFAERRSPSVVVGRHVQDSEVRKTMYEIYEGYKDMNHRHSDEEDFSDLRLRANRALDFLRQHEAPRLCVVMHGLFLRMLFCAAINGADFTGVDLQRAIRGLEMDNTGISYFRLVSKVWLSEEETYWQVVSWNDSAHLG